MERKVVVIKIKVASSINNNILRSKCEENHKDNQSNKDKRPVLEKTNTPIYFYLVQTNMSYIREREHLFNPLRYSECYKEDTRN